MISSHGYEKTSMESIAERAEIATGTLYNYYKSKPTLLIAIYANLMTEMLKTRPQRHQGPFTADLALVELTDVLHFFSRSVMLFPKSIARRLYAQMFILEPEELTLLSAIDMEIVAMIYPILEDMIAAELLAKDADIEQVSIMLYGSMMIIHQTYIMLDDMTEEQLSVSISSQLKMQFYGLLPRELLSRNS